VLPDRRDKKSWLSESPSGRPPKCYAGGRDRTPPGTWDSAPNRSDQKVSGQFTTRKPSSNITLGHLVRQQEASASGPGLIASLNVGHVAVNASFRASCPKAISCRLSVFKSSCGSPEGGLGGFDSHAPPPLCFQWVAAFPAPDFSSSFFPESFTKGPARCPQASFHEAAEGELNEAADFHDLASLELGRLFIDEIQRTIGKITEFPEAAPLVRGRVRRKPIAIFPYSIIYAIRSE